MNQRITSGLAAAAAITVLGWATLGGALLARPAAAEGINIYNWNDYIGETTLDDFTKATGTKPHYDVYDSLELLEQKLLVGHSGYDVVVPTAEPTLARLIKAKVLQPLDKSKIPNLANLDPDLMKQVASTDPGNRFGAIYQWGTIGIGILPAKIKALMPNAPIDSFDLLFKPEVVKKLAPCGITLLDSAIDVVPTVLHYLGLDPNSEKADDLKKVEKTLMAVRPFIKNFVTGQNINNLAGGDTCVVFAYNGDVLQARDRAIEAGGGLVVEYLVPKEGVQLWFDNLAVPVDAPNAAAAFSFINFVLQPEVMAGISKFTKYANAVPASREFLDPAVRNNPAIYPPKEAIAKMFTVHSISQAAERARTRMWTRVKTGK
ncbi:MAG: extracellular solute-binding protein [Azospirillum sp.]|nr:extracellular solute-binding protein [Azospirillum sp.]